MVACACACAQARNVLGSLGLRFCAVILCLLVSDRRKLSVVFRYMNLSVIGGHGILYMKNKDLREKLARYTTWVSDRQVFVFECVSTY